MRQRSRKGEKVFQSFASRERADCLREIAAALADDWVILSAAAKKGGSIGNDKVDPSYGLFPVIVCPVLVRAEMGQ